MQLPKVGERLDIIFNDGRETLDLLVLAIDEEQGVWTVLRSDTGEYDLIALDENGNYAFQPRHHFKDTWEG